MSKFDKFLQDDAVVTGDIATNTAGASGETSQDSDKKVSKIAKRLAEGVIKFTINDEQGAQVIAKLQEKYPDTVWTFNVNTDIIGETTGGGLVQVSDVWYKDINTALTDSKFIELSS